MSSTYFSLNESRRHELREMLISVSQQTDEYRKINLIIIKLARSPAILTYKQLYLASVILSRSGRDVPLWVHEMLFSRDEPIFAINPLITQQLKKGKNDQ